MTSQRDWTKSLMNLGESDFSQDPPSRQGTLVVHRPITVEAPQVWFPRDLSGRLETVEPVASTFWTGHELCDKATKRCATRRTLFALGVCGVTVGEVWAHLAPVGPGTHVANIEAFWC